jgi:hypothetical protein
MRSTPIPTFLLRGSGVPSERRQYSFGRTRRSAGWSPWSMKGKLAGEIGDLRGAMRSRLALTRISTDQLKAVHSEGLILRDSVCVSMLPLWTQFTIPARDRNSETTAR